MFEPRRWLSDEQGMSRLFSHGVTFETQLGKCYALAWGSGACMFPMISCAAATVHTSNDPLAYTHRNHTYEDEWDIQRLCANRRLSHKALVAFLQRRIDRSV